VVSSTAHIAQSATERLLQQENEGASIRSNRHIFRVQLEVPADGHIVLLNEIKCDVVFSHKNGSQSCKSPALLQCLRFLALSNFPPLLFILVP
jgi:hypothetical protein